MRPGILRVRKATAFGLAAACAGSLALAGAVGVPAASADSVRDGQLWALNMMNVQQVWDQGNEGQGVTVAVLDSGVTPDVSDLSGSVVSGPDYTGVSTSPGNADWGQHGTWMASIIAGHGHGLDDDDGIMGVASKAKILSVRVIPDRDDPGYSTYEREQEDRVQDSLAKGITYAVNHGANVISMSIGYSAPSASVRSALQYAYGHGVAVVASSGNSGDTPSASKQGYAPLKYPADYPGVIGVAAVSSSGHVAGFSSNNLSVEVAAPGVNISAQGRDGQYWLVTGTSPACALVAGVAALIKSKYPALAPDLVAKALSSTTHYRPSGGYDPKVGFGTVDADAALTAAATLGRQRAASTGTAASHNFGGGPSAAAPEPVTPRGSGQLILFAVLAVTALALVAAAVSRLAVLNQLRRREHAELSAASVPVSNASFGRPPHPGPAQPQGAAHPSPAHPGSAQPGPDRPGFGQPGYGQPDPAQSGQARYGAVPTYGPPPPSRDRQPGHEQSPHGAPQYHQAPDRQPSQTIGREPWPPEPLPTRTPGSSQSRPAPESESRDSRSSPPPPVPQPTYAPQRPPASQPPPESQATRPLPLPHSSREPVESHGPGESFESHEPEEPQEDRGYRAPSGWWHPSDVDN